MDHMSHQSRGDLRHHEATVTEYHGASLLKPAFGKAARKKKVTNGLIITGIYIR